MKRIITSFVVLCLFTFLAIPALATNSPSVYIGDKAVSGAVWHGESIYLPLRSMGQILGLQVEYEPARRVVIIKRADGGYLELSANQNSTEAVFMQGITYVPLRFVGEWLNYQVDYKYEQVCLSKLAAVLQTDTLTLPAGNLNCNLLNNKYCVFWRGNLYYWCSLSNTLNRLNGVENQIEVATGSYHSFNIYQNELYAVYNGKEPYTDSSFYKLNTENFLPQQKILQGSLQYCKIQDGWLYFQREEDGELYRRLIAGGEVEPLGINNAAEIIITDQHIFATMKTPEYCRVLQTNLDGTHPKLLTELVGRSLKLLDYADGRLYMTLDSNAKATIWSMRQDGAEFKQLSVDGAGEACVFDGKLYYSRLEPLYYSDINGFADLSGRTIWCMPIGGGEAEQVSPMATEAFSGYDQPIIWNGDVFYRKFANMSHWYWHKVNRKNTV